LVQIAMLQRVSVRVTDEDLLKFMIMRFWTASHFNNTWLLINPWNA
jgi:hypothetical protein